ncbi:MAG: hypothetical protein KGN32_12545 [Burkholderiales bacterium]|nr:hypothetical protein [Burkholderiales bacterium]
MHKPTVLFIALIAVIAIPVSGRAQRVSPAKLVGRAVPPSTRLNADSKEAHAVAQCGRCSATATSVTTMLDAR